MRADTDDGESNGSLNLCSRTSILLGSPPLATWRYFSSCAPRAKAVVKPKAPHNPSKTTQETLKFAGRRPEGFGRLERKVAKEGDLLLFKAPSQRFYVLGAYSIAGFCLAYSVYNSSMVFGDQVIPLPMWQKSLFGGICVMMSVMGTVFIVKTARLVKAVNAIHSNGKTYLRFTVRSMIPFRKPYQFDALPRQIAFSRRLVVSPESLRPQTTPNAQPAKVSIYRAPLTKMSQVLWKGFRSVRQIFTQEDIILLEVEGQKGVFRMDSAGYISEDFLVIGNPVSIRSY
ncbi:hypothetical protein CNMCM5793_007138 [Aspergillus hiratsukae]|uniref:Uncharacterized protein n=1 Tax=Aspergillus hiratsukae TaxID=1194566 RepID=A0A8H6P511_9EURO|nr:hypothetical protein CNMCM5793_007138 [Aspergillus hiratsukae]